MNFKILLYPFALIYGLIVSLRNFLFNKGLIKSQKFDLPVISVGNLVVGGTGKTPHIEYLINLLSNKKTATLSRGYGRKKKGFIIASDASSALEIGDEPAQFNFKFPDITIAVDEERVRGISNLLKDNASLETVLLDDAFQHRYVTPSLSIVLTDYFNLYIDDHMMPAGNLREYKSGIKRADIIIITKCPHKLVSIERKVLKENLKTIGTSKNILFYH